MSRDGMAREMVDFVSSFASKTVTTRRRQFPTTRSSNPPFLPKWKDSTIRTSSSGNVGIAIPSEKFTHGMQFVRYYYVVSFYYVFLNTHNTWMTAKSLTRCSSCGTIILLFVVYEFAKFVLFFRPTTRRLKNWVVVNKRQGGWGGRFANCAIVNHLKNKIVNYSASHAFSKEKTHRMQCKN